MVRNPEIIWLINPDQEQVDQSRDIEDEQNRQPNTDSDALCTKPYWLNSHDDD